MSGHAVEAPAGIEAFAFGKLPAHGDFISRGLGDEAIESADAVIALALALGISRWDTAWDDLYIETPVWRFLATPGVLGPDWTAGVFAPSVDSVGRQYPLIAGFSCSTLHMLAGASRLVFALDAAETSVRNALLNASPVDDLIHHLSATWADPASEPEAFLDRAFATLAATPQSMHALWWVAGGGEQFRLEIDGPLTCETVCRLFQRAEPASVEIEALPGPVEAPPETAASQSPDAGGEAGQDKSPSPVVSSPDPGGASHVPRPT